MLRYVLLTVLLLSSCSNETINNLVTENENLKKEALERDKEIKKLEEEIKDIEFEFNQLKESEDKLYFELKEHKEELLALQKARDKRPEVAKVDQPPNQDIEAKTIEQWALFLDKKKMHEVRDLLDKPNSTHDSGLSWVYWKKVLEADSGLTKGLHLIFLPRDFFGKSEKAVTFVREDFYGKIACVHPSERTVKYAYSSDFGTIRQRLETWIQIKNGWYRR